MTDLNEAQRGGEGMKKFIQFFDDNADDIGDADIFVNVDHIVQFKIYIEPVKVTVRDIEYSALAVLMLSNDLVYYITKPERVSKIAKQIRDFP